MLVIVALLILLIMYKDNKRDQLCAGEKYIPKQVNANDDLN
jgi:hypothetical protein